MGMFQAMVNYQEGEYIMIDYIFAYRYCGLIYYKVYKDGIYQFTGTEEDIDDYLEIINSK